MSSSKKNTPLRWLGLAGCLAGLAAFAQAAPELKIGMIGVDTSHAILFTSLLNDPAIKDHVPGGRVVCAYKDPSPDLEISRGRVEGFGAQIRDKYGVVLVDSIAEVVARSDAIVVMSVDGRSHLRQARAIFPSGKPVYIDKPLATNLHDAVAIVRLARETNTPLLSASPYRFTADLQRLREAPIGRIRGAISTGNSASAPYMPGFFFEGIHPVEALYTVLGPGCEWVTCIDTPDTEVASGLWTQGRTGVVYGLNTGKKPVSLTVFGEKNVITTMGYHREGYAPLTRAIITFFQTRRSPLPLKDTLEIIAFIEAANQSRQRQGAPVSVQGLLAAEGVN